MSEKELDFDTAFMVKNVSEDINSGIWLERSLTEAIRSAIWKNQNVLETFARIKTYCSTVSQSVIRGMHIYAKHKNLPMDTATDLKKAYESFLIDYQKATSVNYEAKGHPANVDSSIMHIVGHLRRMFKMCDTSLLMAQQMYKVLETSDERFTKPSMESVDKVFDTRLLEEKADPNIGTQDYGKEVCKRCRMFKQRIISLANEYFGKKTVFADFNIVDYVM